MKNRWKKEKTPEYPSSSGRLKRGAMLRRFLFSLFLSAGILFGLMKLAQVSPSVIGQTLMQVSLPALFAGFLLHLSAYFLRSLRFRILIRSKKVSLRALFDIVAVHNFMNHVLPMRTGELSYIYLARYRQNIPLGEGFGTLTIARIMDLMAFTLYCPAAILILHIQGFRFPPVVWKLLWGTMPLFLLLSVFLFMLLLRGRYLLNGYQRFARRKGLRDSAWATKLQNLLERTVWSFDQMKSTRVWITSFILSLVILGTLYLVATVLLKGMGYPMKVPLVIFCSTLAYLGSLLPLYSFAGFGTVEAGWTIGCLAAGYSKEMGLASGFGFHIIVLIYVVLIGMYGLARTGTPGKARHT